MRQLFVYCTIIILLLILITSIYITLVYARNIYYIKTQIKMYISLVALLDYYSSGIFHLQCNSNYSSNIKACKTFIMNEMEFNFVL